jgi:hypothetical protein
MKVSEIIEKLGLTPKTEIYDGDIERVYCGDLLSHAISSLNNKYAWITVQSHINVIAIGALKEIKLIIIAHNRPISDEMIESANSEQICLCSSDYSSYEICGILYKHGIQG